MAEPHWIMIDEGHCGWHNALSNYRLYMRHNGILQSSCLGFAK